MMKFKFENCRATVEKEVAYQLLLDDYDTEHMPAAFAKWSKLYPEPLKLSYKNRVLIFAEFLGYPHRPYGQRFVPVEDPKARHLIDLINGPNGHAVLKMLEARNKS